VSPEQLLDLLDDDVGLIELDVVVRLPTEMSCAVGVSETQWYWLAFRVSHPRFIGPGTRDFCDVTRGAAHQPRQAKPDRAGSRSYCPDVPADVHERRESDYDRPLDSDRDVILASHQGKSADHKRSGKPCECSDRAVSMGRNPER
jgi:hypothetical protein